MMCPMWPLLGSDVRQRWPLVVNPFLLNSLDVHSADQLDVLHEEWARAGPRRPCVESVRTCTGNRRTGSLTWAASTSSRCGVRSKRAA